MILVWGSLTKIMSIGFAGALGAGTRHFVANRSRAHLGERFPWGTLIINLTGAFVIGALAGAVQHHAHAAAWQPALALGFLGGYTTFSTMMLESARLRQRAAHVHVFAYLAASLLGGVLLAWVGLWLGGHI